MNKEHKKNKEKDLGVLANSILDSKDYGREFRKLFDDLGVSRQDMINSVIAYTMHGGSFENSAYADKVMRLTLHLHNLAEGTYHLEKGRAISEYISKGNIESLVDIGYGVPGEHIFDSVSKGLEIKLLDQDRSAEEISRAIFEARGIHTKNVKYGVHDMNVDGHVGDFDAYVLLDSVEHALNPKKYLSELVKGSKKDARFMLSIPIMKNYNEDGKVNAFHYEEWLTTGDAVKWLDKVGLDVLDSKEIIPNPDVDFFAYLSNSTAGPSYKCFVVNCKKKEARNS